MIPKKFLTFFLQVLHRLNEAQIFMFGMKCTTLDNKNESMENVIFRAQDFLNFANMFTNLEILPLNK
jgi:hypothetical protein